VFTLVRNGEIESIQSALNGSLFHTLLISLILMIIQNTFTLIPLILLITINVTLFGFFYGFIWSWLTSIIAAVIVFIGVRYYFQDQLMKKMNAKLIDKVEKNGFLYVFGARMFPFVPTSIINIVTGLSSIQFKQFILGTMIGNFIYIFVLSLIPLGLLSKNIDKYVLGIIIVLSVISFYLYKKLNNRTKRNKLIKMNVNDQQGHKGDDRNF
jgi:uncharacterized membrane protein YdjX (TVP38/TMEM64 family)